MLSKEKVIEAMAKCLNEKEREILSARWGLENGITIRIEELKEIYGITIDQLRDIERKIILLIESSIRINMNLSVCTVGRLRYSILGEMIGEMK
ncbi:hypothetical protein [Desulfosporosinus acidiphilus]|uniref:hypothetical protein n=1 Tax=Desulfosporosinus acidiphilus TaxID=885581 RepID=UPI000257A7FC|nr:hypothetical protein [Desulfosporosinus acidiphilus]